MQDFARWLGKMAAGGAAVLALLLVVAASPATGEARDEATRICQERAMARARDAALSGPHSTELELFRACPRLAAQWNGDRLTQAALAAGAAVVLLLLTAMVPQGRRD